MALFSQHLRHFQGTFSPFWANFFHRKGVRGVKAVSHEVGCITYSFHQTNKKKVPLAFDEVKRYNYLQRGGEIPEVFLK